MSVGIQISRAEIDNRSGSVARSVHSVLRDVEQFKAWLDTVTTSDLQNIYDYTSDEAALLKSALADLAELAAVFKGGNPRGAAYDYRTFAQRLIGTGLF